MTGISKADEISFHRLDQECYNWSLRSNDPAREVSLKLNNIDVIVVFSRIANSASSALNPNRISVGSVDPKIKEIFQNFLWQPETFAHLKQSNLWVFRNNPNVSMPGFQYQLDFFPSEHQLRENLKTANHNSNLCALL